MKPPRIQQKPELYWRYSSKKIGNKEGRPWVDTLYIAHVDGRLEGYYDKTISGDEYETPRWESPRFNRGMIQVDLEDEFYPWEFICELE